MPFVNVRNALPLVAFHAHPACVVTLTLPLPPASGTLALPGLIDYVHETAAAACETAKALPAIVAVPMREEVAVFVATE